MKVLIGLIALQALAANASFHQRRQKYSNCTLQVTETITRTVIPSPVTLTVTLGSLFDIPAASLSPIPEESSNTSRSSAESASVSIPTASRGEIFIRTILESSGDDFFAPVSTSTVIPSVSVSTVPTNSGTAQVLPSLSTQTPATQGTIITSLNANGQPSTPPLISSSIPTPSILISPTALAASILSIVSPGMTSDNIFQPVATDAPPVSSRPDHPLARLGIQNQTAPIGTNKFYGNFYLGSQSAPTWTNPYSVAWSKGGGSSGSWGMAITHLDSNQRVFGPDPNANPVSYFINPVGIHSLLLSATELGPSTQLTMDSITAFAANIHLSPNAGAVPAITFPLVQGMGFVTGIFHGGTPILQSGIFFRTITKADGNPKPGVTKYRIELEDGKQWLVYAYSRDGTGIEFQTVNNGLIQATSNFNGIIQIAKNPGGAEEVYDAACGAYATDVSLSGSSNGAQGSYTLGFTKAGLMSSTLLMFALSHHVASLSSQTKAGLTNVQLNTNTKGTATAIVADSWTLVEDIPTTMGFAPWSPEAGSQSSLSAAAISMIHSVAASEVSQDMNAQTNLDSMYFSGKALAKFAGIVYTLHDLLKDRALAQAGLSNLKTAFSTFVCNNQITPLVHERAWGGVVSTSSYISGDAGGDFGNTYYNDHHFHYGYFVYTAAIIGYLDPAWLTTQNKAWVNMLVRDYANPSPLDTVFPVSRNFDWYHGHSWAHGLYETFDGKDEESSSEDSMSAYAIKMWGRTTGDANMEARGNLQLAVTARSLQSYFLYESGNTIQPRNYINNKVAGILFENKVEHMTYFSTNIECIQGIHMIPLLPPSTLSRTKTFVQEEWDVYFSNGRANAVQNGWKGILYANLAIINPQAAWQFFSQSGFDASWIDGGASRTWYLAFAAGLGGAP